MCIRDSTVSGQETGINIYKDNNFFTFINKNGGIYDENAGPDGQTWSFSKHDVPAWGADNTAPSRGDLSYAEGGSRLTFRTVASAIDLYVKGTVQVESTFPGFAAQTVAAEGGTAGYAVSYTHLDVYKRQWPNCGTLSEATAGRANWTTPGWPLIP